VDEVEVRTVKTIVGVGEVGVRAVDALSKRGFDSEHWRGSFEFITIDESGSPRRLDSNAPIESLGSVFADSIAVILLVGAEDTIQELALNTAKAAKDKAEYVVAFVVSYTATSGIIDIVDLVVHVQEQHFRKPQSELGVADVLIAGARAICSMSAGKSVVCVDLADLKKVFSNREPATIGVACATGQNRVEKAASKAVASLGANLRDSRSVYVSICCSSVTLLELHEVFSKIQDAANEDAEVMWAWMHGTPDSSLEVTLLAGDGHTETGIEG
jgi:hypothetical protein